MVKIQADEKDERTAVEQLDKVKAAYVHTILSTKVPISGGLRIDNKDSKADIFLSQNINSMSFWLQNNYKAERLKFMLKKYNIDITGF